MCGITGFWTSKPNADQAHNLKRMNDAISHRGPDSEGFWSSNDQSVHLAHRRLAIIDLSPAGHQPMASHSGRYQLTYNGEIYNHLAIRQSLEKQFGSIAWHGHSDTETLLEAISLVGIDATLKMLAGMFALAVWDLEEHKLHLARDRMGEKPLYYGNSNGTLLFGSELKALRAHPSWSADVSQQSLDAFLRFSSVPSPQSIYTGFFKLPPAHMVTIDNVTADLPEPKPYWNRPLFSEETQLESTPLTDKQHLDNLEEHLMHVVQSCTLADVPIGSFLSGGIDSSLITALLHAQSDQTINTFTIGFSEQEYDEAPYAKAIAEHLNANHTELYVTENDALNLVPDLPTLYDEPFADSSQLPTLLLAKLTVDHVKVSLSGDGGDELFYGYSRYIQTKELWQKIEKYPASARQLVGNALGAIAPPVKSSIDNLFNGKPGFLRQKLHSIEQTHSLLASNSFETFYEQMLTLIKNPLLREGVQNRLSVDAYAPCAHILAKENKMMSTDMRHYLPDVVLTKVDRATMAHGLEARAPLLDHRLVEYAANLPLHLKYRNGQQKWALQQILSKHIPDKLFDRPKMGFAVPIDHWLRGALKDWTMSLLDEKRLAEEGFFNPELVTRLLQNHLSGRENNHFQLWNILMFQAWLDKEK